MSNEKNSASNIPSIDFDAIDRRINERFERGNSSDDSMLAPPSSPDGFGLAGYGGFTAPQEEEVEQKQLELKAPFIILQFDHQPVEDEENIVNIAGFQLNAEGLDPNPESILVHLEMVVENIKEQMRNGDINDSVTE